MLKVDTSVYCTNKMVDYRENTYKIESYITIIIYVDNL